jgi:hypothetical protein
VPTALAILLAWGPVLHSGCHAAAPGTEEARGVAHVTATRPSPGHSLDEGCPFCALVRMGYLNTSVTDALLVANSSFFADFSGDPPLVCGTGDYSANPRAPPLGIVHA